MKPEFHFDDALKVIDSEAQDKYHVCGLTMTILVILFIMSRYLMKNVIGFKMDPIDKQILKIKMWITDNSIIIASSMLDDAMAK